MTYIQITDINPSDFEGDEVEELKAEELKAEELTDEELLAINGGGFFGGAMRLMGSCLYAAAAIVDEVL